MRVNKPWQDLFILDVCGLFQYRSQMLWCVSPAAALFLTPHTWSYSCSSLCRECSSCLLSANCCWSKVTSCCSLNTHQQLHSLHSRVTLIRKKQITMSRNCFLHTQLLFLSAHMVSLTCCCAPDCFVCPDAVVGFVGFVHSCVSAASSTPPSIAPPLTPPAADGHAQKAPPPGAAPPLHCSLHHTNIKLLTLQSPTDSDAHSANTQDCNMIHVN